MTAKLSVLISSLSSLMSFIKKNTMKLLVPVFIGFILIGTIPVFAETNHLVKIPTGAADPESPYFWSVQSTGNTNGMVEAFPNDTVVWKNSDTVDHTVAAETLDNQELLFDSGLIKPGQEFRYQFTELGVYEYFCHLHPWMSGTVNVIKNPGQVKTLKNVASGFDEYGVGFDVKYILDTKLSNSVDVSPQKNTLTFYLSDKTENEKITISLPFELIENPNTVWVDDKKVDNFTVEISNDGTRLIIPLESSPSKITIMGSHVIPEFEFVVLILIASIVGLVVLSKKQNLLKATISN